MDAYFPRVVMILWFVFFLQACATVETIKDIYDANTNQGSSENKNRQSKPVSFGSGEQSAGYISRRPESVDLSGHWVFEVNCEGGRPIYGLMNIKKQGGRNYAAEVFYFSSLSLGRSRGTIFSLSGSFDDAKFELALNFDKSHYGQMKEFRIIGEPSNNQMLISGSYSGDRSAHCQAFTAAKYTEFEDEKKARLNLSGTPRKGGSLLSVITRGLTSSKVSEKDCLEYFNFIASGSNRRILGQQINDVLLDEDKLAEYIGKGYDNWTEKDAKGYVHLKTTCQRTAGHSKALQQAYNSMRRKMNGFQILELGKDRNISRSGSKTSFFGSGKLPNIVWAGNSFYLAVERAAEIQESVVIDELKSLPPTEETLAKLEEYKTLGNFPLNILGREKKNALMSRISDINTDKSYLYIQDRYSGFSPDQYPKTLEGLRAARADLNRIHQEVSQYDSNRHESTITAEHEKALEKHSQQAAQDIIAALPEVKPSPDGIQQYKHHALNAKNNDIPLLSGGKDKALVTKALDERWETLLDALAVSLPSWMDSNIKDAESDISKLDELSKVVLEKPLSNLQSDSFSESRKVIADLLIEKSNDLKDDCDQFSAHPLDKQKPSYIAGIHDNQMDQDQALDACITSIEREPDNQRFNFQLGRALYLSQLFDEARPYLEEASNNDYSAANYYLGLLNLEGHAGFKENTENAVAFFDKAAEGGFTPAIEFVEDYRKNLAALKKQEDQKNESVYNHPKLIQSLLSGELHNDLPYSVQMLYIHDMMKVMHEFCPDLVSANDLKRMAGYLKSPNAGGYNKYVKKSIKKTGIRIFDSLMLEGGQRSHPNDAFDKDTREYHASSDVFNIVKQYQCYGIETENFVKNAKKYMDTAPPYNLTSQPYWDACMKDTPNLSVSKSKFCGCFLGTARGGKANNTSLKMLLNSKRIRYFNHESANNLLKDFWGTAKAMIAEFPVFKQCRDVKKSGRL